MLSPLVILSIVVGYFTLLCLISRWTSQQADNQTFLPATETPSGILWPLA